VGSTISRPSSHVAALDVEGNDAANLAILGGDLGVARLYVARLGTFVLRFHSGPPPRAWALVAVVAAMFPPSSITPKPNRVS